MTRITEVLLITLFLAVGFCAVAVPTAYGSIVGGGMPSTPVSKQTSTLDAAEAACSLIKEYNDASPLTGAWVETECYVRDWAALDFTVNVDRPQAIEICDDVARIVAKNVSLIAGKGWSLRVFGPGVAPPLAGCRVI